MAERLTRPQPGGEAPSGHAGRCFGAQRGLTRGAHWSSLLRMTQWKEGQLPYVADILMAAAGADQEMLSAETSTVRKILKELSGARVSPELDARVRGFDAKRFDLAAASKGLGALDADGRRALLALVSRVTESDDVHDLAESDFIVRVAGAIGAAPEEYAGLTVSLRPVTPPPVPKGH